MLGLKSLRLWLFIVVLVVFCGMAGCSAYMRLGTTLVADFPSPDGKSDAMLMVRNGGAMTGYATVVSLNANTWAGRHVALFWPAAFFVADDNDGAVRLGQSGQVDVKVRWESATQLVVAYPENARVFRRASEFRSVIIRYVASQ